MKLWLIFWAYWKWFCTALVTSTLLLLIVAMLIQVVKSGQENPEQEIERCLDRGGTWDEEGGICKTAA